MFTRYSDRSIFFTNGIDVDSLTIEQVNRTSSLPFIHKHVAVMPDCHYGKGSTVGTVIPTIKAVVPATIGVDIGCGMLALNTGVDAKYLPDNLHQMRIDIESVVPVGFGIHKDEFHLKLFEGELLSLNTSYKEVVDLSNGFAEHKDVYRQLGTLGGGNHFIELCLDENNQIWIMLHTGSRGVGNRIGRYYIEKAKEEMERYYIDKYISDIDLSYLVEDSKYFTDYIYSVNFAQQYAKLNRSVMLQSIVNCLMTYFSTDIFKDFKDIVIDCHHNYIEKENHFGSNIYVARKGAVRARVGDTAIIPNAMGQTSYIVEGLGNKMSFCSCSHGAGRKMSRNEARKLITLSEHAESMKGVECRLDEGVIDESPSAYKDINAVMNAQKDLVKVKHRLKAVLNIKG